jgi:hypothetical protein
MDRQAGLVGMDQLEFERIRHNTKLSGFVEAALNTIDATEMRERARSNPIDELVQVQRVLSEVTVCRLGKSRRKNSNRRIVLFDVK